MSGLSELLKKLELYFVLNFVILYELIFSDFDFVLLIWIIVVLNPAVCSDCPIKSLSLNMLIWLED